MSRVAKEPVVIPSGVEVRVQDNNITAKGPKGTSSLRLHPTVEVAQEGNQVSVVPKDVDANAMAGTMRSLLNNLVIGVHQGFERRLQLVGVGYRAQVNGRELSLSLGFSHPVQYTPPEGVTVEAPTQTEVVVTGVDKQIVGQAAAIIRGYRPPEPYKGKGVRYVNERIVMKEAKKA